jgi:hypothetical protein
MSEKVKITNLEFSADEWETVRARARKKNKKTQLETLTLPNILRLALGLEQKKRGGARSNTGNSAQKSQRDSA